MNCLGLENLLKSLKKKCLLKMIGESMILKGLIVETCDNSSSWSLNEMNRRCKKGAHKRNDELKWIDFKVR